MNKQISKFILIVVSLLCLTITTSCDAIFFLKSCQRKSEVSNFESNDFKFELNKLKNSDGVCLIANPEKSYSGKIIIPETIDYKGTTYPVTVIAEKAFENCNSIDTVLLCKNIQVIGEEAFANSSLTYINLNGVQIIGNESFRNCNKMIDLTLHDIQIVGDEAFSNCDSLRNITIQNVQIIGDKAFKDCNSLRKVCIKDVQIIGNEAFKNCNMLNEVIKENVQVIDKNAF